MRGYLPLVMSITSVWLASAGLNSGYLPWGAAGVVPKLLESGICATLAMCITALSISRLAHAGVMRLAALISAIYLFLSLIEIVFWLSGENDHLMFYRQDMGIKVSFILNFILAVTLVKFPIEKMPSSPNSFPNVRFLCSIIFTSSLIELLLFLLRSKFGIGMTELTSDVYYATDCSMFAIFVTSSGIFISSTFLSVADTIRLFGAGEK